MDLTVKAAVGSVIAEAAPSTAGDVATWLESPNRVATLRVLLRHSEHVALRQLLASAGCTIIPADSDHFVAVAVCVDGVALVEAAVSGHVWADEQFSTMGVASIRRGRVRKMLNAMVRLRLERRLVNVFVRRLAGIVFSTDPGLLIDVIATESPAGLAGGVASGLNAAGFPTIHADAVSDDARVCASTAGRMLDGVRARWNFWTEVWPAMVQGFNVVRSHRSVPVVKGRPCVIVVCEEPIDVATVGESAAARSAHVQAVRDVWLYRQRHAHKAIVSARSDVTSTAVAFVVFDHENPEAARCTIVP